MKNVKIEEVKFGRMTDGSGNAEASGNIVCEVAYTEEDGTKGFMSVVELADIAMPHFMNTPESVYEDLLMRTDKPQVEEKLAEYKRKLKEDFRSSLLETETTDPDDKSLDEMVNTLASLGALIKMNKETINNYSFDYDGDYEDIFADPDPEWHDLIRYLIAIVRAPESENQPFIQTTTGKWLSEIEIPVSDVEEDYYNNAGKRRLKISSKRNKKRKKQHFQAIISGVGGLFALLRISARAKPGGIRRRLNSKSEDTKDQ